MLCRNNFSVVFVVVGALVITGCRQPLSVEDVFNDLLSQEIALTPGSWSAENMLVNPSSTSTCEPAIASFNGKIWMFFKSNSGNDIRYRSSSNNGVTWTAEKVAPGKTTTPVAVIYHDQRLYLFHKGEGSNQRIYYSSMNTSEQWTSEYILRSDILTIGAPAVCTDGLGAILLVWQANAAYKMFSRFINLNNGAITSYSPQYQVQVWNSSSGSFMPPLTDRRPAVASIWMNGQRYFYLVFRMKNTSNKFYYVYYATGTQSYKNYGITSWTGYNPSSGWFKVPDMASRDAAALTAYYDNYDKCNVLACAWRSNSGNDMIIKKLVSNGQWQTNFALTKPGTTVNSPAVCGHNGRFWLAHRGETGPNLYWKYNTK